MGIVRIEVVAFDGRPPTLQLAADFDELGGTLGRDPACTLVLPDPEKRISRRHGVVVLRDGRYVLRDEGSAIPIRHNGRAVGLGHEVVLGAGDQIDLGAYALRVSFPAVAQSTAPRAAGAAGEDLLARLGPEAPSARDPFGDLIPKAPLSASLPGGGAPMPPGAAGAAMLPPDFDPFVEPVPPTPSAPPPLAVPGDPLGLGFPPPGRAESVDRLFALRPGELFPPGHPLAPPGEAGVEPGIDSLLATPRVRPGAGPAQRDDVAELHGSMKLPEPKRSSPASLEVSDGLVVSWEQAPRDGGAGEVKTLLIPPVTPGVPPPADAPPASRPAGPPSPVVADARRAAPPEPPAVMSPLGLATPLPGAPRPAATPPGRPDPGARGETGAGRDPLLTALLEGAGVSEVPLRELTPELMRIVGTLLRIAIQGTLDLLQARTAVKGELRAELTVIAPVENNPLKFSPNVEAALAHLLAPHGRGFIPPPRALHEAYRDLVAHQVAFAAGVRAALAATLARFDPAELEGRLGETSPLDPLLPSRRRARLWDLYAERFAELSDEAEQGFNRLFEREFVRAYEAQIAQLARPGTRDAQ
jgi:FHA domain-containing protein